MKHRGRPRRPIELLPWWAKVLYDMRQSRRMSQKRLSKDADVAITTISGIENGRQEPSLPMYERLVDALGGDLEVIQRPEQLTEQSKDEKDR